MKILRALKNVWKEVIIWEDKNENVWRWVDVVENKMLEDNM